MDLGPEHIAAVVNLVALVWGAAKMHASVQGLEAFREKVEEFRKEISGVITEHTKKIARIDIRVSLLERQTGGGPDEYQRDTEFYDRVLEKLNKLE